MRCMRFLDQGDYKIRTIGGKKVDLFTLYHSALVHCGVRSVISTRTFQLVGVALNQSKSYTSAANIQPVDCKRYLTSTVQTETH